MARKTITITMKITVRDFTKEERDDEGLDKEDCEGNAADFDGTDLAESIAAYVEAEQDEILAGSNAYVKIVSAEAHAE